MKQLIFLLLFVTSLAQAAPGVVLIHGFGNFFDTGTNFDQGFSSFYWTYWKDHAFKKYEVRELTWDSKFRVVDQLDSLVRQYRGFLDEGHCDDGCVVVTHSTGGLVGDVLMSRSLESEGSTNDFSAIQKSTLVMIQIASAVGGVSFANESLDWVESSCRENPKGISGFLSLSALVLAINEGKVPSTPVTLGTVMRGVFPHIKCEDVVGTAGAVIDLIPENAREINHSDNTGVETLMIAGNGDLFGGLLKKFLVGESDGLVAMHSACGAREVGDYESCVSHVNASGKTDRVYSAPTEFYNNHYPFMMTEESHDTQLVPLIPLRREVIIDQRLPLKSKIHYMISKHFQFRDIHLSDIFKKFFKLKKLK